MRVVIDTNVVVSAVLKNRVPEEIIALLPQTDIIARGDTIEDAKTNLKQAIYDDYHYLLQYKNTLSDRLLAQLNYWETLFQE